jgi:hypothetical protein
VTTLAQRAQVAARRDKAIALSIAGVDNATIAQELGYASEAALRKDIHRALAGALKSIAENTGALSAMNLARLDRLQAALWPAAVRGDVNAATVVLRCIVERERWFGRGAAGGRVDYAKIGRIVEAISKLTGQPVILDDEEADP